MTTTMSAAVRRVAESGAADYADLLKLVKAGLREEGRKISANDVVARVVARRGTNGVVFPFIEITTKAMQSGGRDVAAFIVLPEYDAQEDMDGAVGWDDQKAKSDETDYMLTYSIGRRASYNVAALAVKSFFQAERYVENGRMPVKRTVKKAEPKKAAPKRTTRKDANGETRIHIAKGDTLGGTFKPSKHGAKKSAIKRTAKAA